jgi:heat shock protein HslJ
MRTRIGSLALFALAACGPKPPAQDEPPSDRSAQPAPAAPAAAGTSPITDQDWILVELGERPAPMGAGNRPLTLRLQSAESRAVGFAGCNRYSGGYTLAADSLRFGPAISTKMSCGEADKVEQGYLAMLPLVVTYAATDTSLVLNGPGGALARFRKQ